MPANPFADSVAGERWNYTYVRADDRPKTYHLVTIELDGEVWVALNHAAYAPAAEFPIEHGIWAEGTFEKVTE